MFYTIRRVIISSGAAISLACTLYLAWFISQQRFLWLPLVEWVDAQRHPEAPRVTTVISQVQGKATWVQDGSTFVVHGDGTRVYTFRLTGLEVPSPNDLADPVARKQGQLSKAYLANLISNRNVRVDVTFMGRDRSGLGILHANDANVNVAVVEAGMAKVNPQFIKGMSWRDQKALLDAQESAQSRKRGLWAEK